MTVPVMLADWPKRDFDFNDIDYVSIWDIVTEPL